MIKKIFSGGHSGVEQAVLDAAFKWKIPHGGWVPEGRQTDYGLLPNRYHLNEIPPGSDIKYWEQNILDSDGTVLVSHAPLKDDLIRIKKFAMKQKQPVLHINLSSTNNFNAAKSISTWISERGIEILNVTGPRAGKDPYIYQATIVTFVTVFHLALIEDSMPDPSLAVPNQPQTIEEAVDQLLFRLTLKDKMKIAKMTDDELRNIYLSFEDHVRYQFGLWSDNRALMDSCRAHSVDQNVSQDDALDIIMKALWRKLRETNKIRRIK